MNGTNDHHSRIREQYSEAVGSLFYRQVMGDGGAAIHYGLYDSAGTTMREAVAAASARMLDIARQRMHGGRPGEVVDLGAGPGESACFLAAETRAMVTCVDLCEHHQRATQQAAAGLGLMSLVSSWQGSFERLPAAWSERFDLAWSQEAFCHAQSVTAAFQEAFRVLREGGIMVFSDILLADGTEEEKASAFRNVNAVTQCRTEQEYRRELLAAGFVDVTFEDWSAQLPANFRRMRAQIDEHRSDLLMAGVPADFIDRFAASLDERLRWSAGQVLRWGMFAAGKP